MSTERPKGRESVRQALIQAAEELFASRGPAAVSVREIAKRAGVNHGLVHRHFGSKEGLLREVLAGLTVSIEQEVSQAGADLDLSTLLREIVGATSQQGAWLRILAWSILEGEPAHTLQERFPMAERMLSAARELPGEELSAEARVTLIMSTGLGMLLFGPFLKAATLQSDQHWESTRRQILTVLTRGV